MEELSRRKGSVGSGNMSTPATTSSNASSSGYGFAPLFEALGLLGGSPTPTEELAEAALGTTGSVAAANMYTDPTNMRGKSNEEIRAAAEAAAIANPLSIAGIDVGGVGIGALASQLVGGAIGGLPGLILGAVASRGAKSLYQSAVRDQQVENFFKIISQVDIDKDMEGKAGQGKTEINEDDPHNQWIANNIVQQVNESSHNGDGTGQYGYNNPASSYADSPAAPTNNSSSNSWSSTGGYSSDGSTSNNGMAGGTGGAF